ncbi:MAG TPA: hypothetical protein VNS79_09450 [Sphingobium sp.]|nr:hypothetical protein [Sphingobium sp.]
MHNGFRALALAILGVSMGAGGALAQTPASPADRQSAYAAIARLPAFEGVWQADWGSVTRLRAAEGEAPLTASARAIVDAFNAAKAQGENLQTEGANCMPVGLPGAMRYPYPIEIIHSPGKVNIVIETHSQVRSIHTDGRALPEDPDPLFNGSSVGRWEGDTLVVDTIGLAPQISLIAGLHPTENTRIRERIHLDGPQKLVVETTITDPALFSAPFTTSMFYKLEPDWEIREYVCQENNRDAADAEGRPSMDLGLGNGD